MQIHISLKSISFKLKILFPVFDLSFHTKLTLFSIN